ncbi:homeobox protein NANOG-like [Ambystoma mexicanum]|uniref:homeobox protein NANOG-like n=1 Tax=Ambystoma mexicanum TaxID=8296 RepID=UPI0037E911B1
MSSPASPLTPGQGSRPAVNSQLPGPTFSPSSGMIHFRWNAQAQAEGSDCVLVYAEKGAPAPDWSSTSPDSAIDLSPTDPVCSKFEFPSLPDVDKVKVAEKKPKLRACFSTKQLLAMQERFEQQKYLSPMQIQELSTSLGLTYKQVKTWFQNRRIKNKKAEKYTAAAGKNSTMQFNSQPVPCCAMPPGFPSGYPIHAGENIIGPVAAPLHHPNPTLMLGPEEQPMRWNGDVFPLAPVPPFKQHSAGLAKQDLDFWPNIMVMEGMRQGDCCSFPPPWTCQVPAGFYHGYEQGPNCLPLQNYPPQCVMGPPQWGNAEQL